MRVAIWLACLALVGACGREERSAAPATPPVVAAPADSQGRLDPTPYRPRIEAAEALLYSGAALSPEEWKALSAEFLALHNEIVFADGSMSARDTSAALFFLSARADALTNSSRGEAEREQLRIVWQKIGGQAFTPTTWMRAQAAGAP